MIHSDIVGHVEPVSIGDRWRGNLLYILTTIAKCCRLAKFYMILSISQVIECFEEIKASLERVMSFTGKVLHMEKALEHMSLAEGIQKD